MIYDITGMILTPGNKGNDCLGNGECCDECDYLMCCTGNECDCRHCDVKECPNQKSCC